MSPRLRRLAKVGALWGGFGVLMVVLGVSMQVPGLAVIGGVLAVIGLIMWGAAGMARSD